MRDVADTIIEQWRGERPDLDLTSMAVTVRITRVATLFDRALDDECAFYGLAGWEYDVLAALRRCGPPFKLAVHRLRNTTMISQRTMPHRLDRLTKRGLVVRGTNPMTARLTAEGQALVDEVAEARLSRERTLLAGLDQAGQQQLAGLLRKLLLSLDETKEAG